MKTYFFEIEGVKGNSKFCGFSGAIDVEWFSFGSQNGQKAVSKSGGGVKYDGKTVGDLVMYVKSGPDSYSLYLAYLKKKSFKKALLRSVIFSENNDIWKMTTWELGEVTLNSYSDHSSSGSDTLGMDFINLNFKTLTMNHFKEQ